MHEGEAGQSLLERKTHQYGTSMHTVQNLTFWSCDEAIAISHSDHRDLKKISVSPSWYMRGRVEEQNEDKLGPNTWTEHENKLQFPDITFLSMWAELILTK